MKQSELRSAVCTQVTPISLAINEHGQFVVRLYPLTSGMRLEREALEDLAIKEGFGTADAMRDWFVKNQKLKPGVVIAAEQIQW